MRNGEPVATQHSSGCLSVTGYTPDDYLANPYLWIDMVHPEDRDAVRQIVAKILACEEVSPIEHRIVRRDGATRWVRDSIVQHYDGAALLRYDGLVEDITDRRQAEATLRETESSLLAAQEIQSRLLPQEAPLLEGYDIAGASFPAAYANGDYFNYLPMAGESLGIVVGDVSGHGLGPALLMATLHAHLQSLVRHHDHLCEILTHANRFLMNESDRFTTLFFGQLWPRTRSFAYVNAGHPTGYVLDASGAVRANLESTSFPLGVDVEAEFVTGDPIVLKPGDLIFLLTDGILEAETPDEAMFGVDRALETVRSSLHEPAQRIVERVYQAIQEFSQPRNLVDDATVVVVKVVAAA
jgi:PAS domain S-box-containing protein